MFNQDRPSFVNAAITQVEKPSQSSGAKSTQVEELDADVHVDELIERTWHYDCVVSPIHPSAPPQSQLSSGKPPLSGQSSKVPPKTALRGGSSTAMNVPNRVLRANKLPSGSSHGHGHEPEMLNGSGAIWQGNKMPRGNPPAISEECEEQNQIKPLRPVMVMMPKNWSELRGYVSLSSFITASSEDQSSSHGHGGSSVESEPAAQVSRSTHGALGALSGFLRIPLISSNKGKRNNSNKSGNDDDANKKAFRSDQERRTSDQSFFLPSQIRRQLPIHN